MAFEKLIDLGRCPSGKSLFVRHADHELAVFHLADPERWFVINNTCPHASGNLSAGEVHGGAVTCPVHHWKFDLTTGRCVGTDDVFVKRYACKVVGPDLFVDLTRPLPVEPPQRYQF